MPNWSEQHVGLEWLLARKEMLNMNASRAVLLEMTARTRTWKMLCRQIGSIISE